MGVRHHMESPKRITMVEVRLLVDRMVKLVSGVGELFPASDIVYMTMFPRHVDKCCDKVDHMMDNEIVVLDSLRRDVDRGVVETLKDSHTKIRVLE